MIQTFDGKAAWPMVVKPYTKGLKGMQAITNNLSSDQQHVAMLPDVIPSIG